MKIAINALPLSEQMTGIGSYTLDLLRATANYGGSHEYFHVVRENERLFIQDLAKKNKQIIALPHIFWEQLCLPSELSARKINVYHSSLFTCPIINEIPSIITIHDMIPESRSDLCHPQFLRFYQTQIGPAIRAARWIVTTSEFSKRQILERLPVDRQNVHVIYQSVSSIFSPANIQKLPQLVKKMTLPQKYILFVGMIEPRKNIDKLISAFGKIATKIPETDLVIIGRKDQEKYSLQNNIQSAGVERRVWQLGYVSSEDLATIYTGATAFAFPSLYEGFGRTVIEAMASGVPVLTANNSSLPEIAGGAAILVDAENIDAIADGLLCLCQDENLRKELKQKGLRRAQNFTSEQFGKRLCSLYQIVEKEL